MFLFILYVRLHVSSVYCTINMWTHQPGSHRRKATHEFFCFCFFTRSNYGVEIKETCIKILAKSSSRNNLYNRFFTVLSIRSMSVAL